MFVNRSDELARLERWWHDPSARLAIVWGRRRVGKTALVRHFAGQRPLVFHTGAGRGARGELALISRGVVALDHANGSRDLATRPYRDWDDALDHMGDLARDRPILLVLDEFPELVMGTPELPNLLRAFIDRAEGRTQLRILLAGSAVRYMAALGEQRQPLYGRADLTVHLKPFKPWEAARMLPDLSPSQCAVVYGLLGGVPLYLSWWDSAVSVAENLAVLACEPGSRLLTEGDLVMATEAEAGEYPAAVLYALANGKTRHNEIKDVVGADPSRTLNRLADLHLVERVQPVTETGRTRRRIYRIRDNFLAFHLSLLGRFRSEIEAGLGKSILPVLTECLDDHLGLPWESAFRAHLRRAAAVGVLGSGVVAVGQWWTADGRVEIDAVALAGRSRTPIAVGEAKWARRLDGRRLESELIRKAASVPDIVEQPTLILAAREEVTGVSSEVVTITAADVFT